MPLESLKKTGCFAGKIFALLTIILFYGTLFSASAAEIRGRVGWVYDGDTLLVEGVGKVRLIGIDTPEREDSSRDATFKRAGISPGKLRHGAQRATDFLIRTAKGKNVTLTFDRDKVDRYDRTLAYVTLDNGRMLNRELISEGLALVYRRFDFQLKEDFLTAEAAARRSGRGLWAKE